MLAANGPRGTQPLIGVRRRHPHIDDGDIRLVRPDGVEQGSRVAHSGDDFVTAPGESLSEAVPHDGGVLGDDDAQRGRGGHQACPGSATVTVVGPP